MISIVLICLLSQSVSGTTLIRVKELNNYGVTDENDGNSGLIQKVNVDTGMCSYIEPENSTFDEPALVVQDGQCFVSSDTDMGCGWGWMPPCAEDVIAIDIPTFELRCSAGTEKCREWGGIEEFYFGSIDGTSSVRISAVGCIYESAVLRYGVNGVDLDDYYYAQRHVLSPDVLFDGPNPNVCVRCGWDGFPQCPTAPFCLRSDSVYDPNDSDGLCRNKEDTTLSCGVSGTPACVLEDTLAWGDDNVDGCFDLPSNQDELVVRACGNKCVEMKNGDVCPDEPVQCSPRYSKCSDSGCCVEGFKCVKKNKFYSQCRPTNEGIKTRCGQKFEQCGGKRWKGSKCCTGGTVCTKKNAFYSQCS